MAELDKARLEAELLLAQKEKVQAEIAILKKTTPFTEGVKIVSSMVIGIGGAIAAIFGFQLAEIKAVKFKQEAEAAAQIRDQAKKEMARLAFISDSLRKSNDSLDMRLKQGISNFEQLSDKIALLQQQEASKQALGNIQQDANAAAINLRASITSQSAPALATTSLTTSIQNLFASKAATRGAAYNQLITYYSTDPLLIPALIDYANRHTDNENGIYNSLVVLANIDYSQIPGELVPQVRAFAERSRNNGPKTAERAVKVIETLPK